MLDAGTRLSRSSELRGRTGCSPRGGCRRGRPALGGIRAVASLVADQFVGMKAEDSKRLKDLERENRELKRIVPDKELENRDQVTGEGAQDARTPRAGYRRPPGL
jgi:hypothetical protein